MSENSDPNNQIEKDTKKVDDNNNNNKLNISFHKQIIQITIQK